MPKSISVKIEKRHGCLWITLPDTIDMDNYHKIENTIEPELLKEGQMVILDFVKTDALFSSGLGVIVRLQKRINEKGSTLHLVNFSRRLQDALENVGLRNVFKTYSTVEEFLDENEIVD